MSLIHSSIFKNIPKIISVSHSLREGGTQKTVEMYLVFMWAGINGAIWPKVEKNVNSKPFFPFMSQKKQSTILAFSQDLKYLQDSVIFNITWKLKFFLSLEFLKIKHW